MSADRGDCPDCGALVGHEDHAPDCPDHDSPPDEDGPPPDPSCGGCRFYLAKAKGFGQCRRNSPTLIDDERKAVWPGVEVLDLCGEFDWREEPEPECSHAVWSEDWNGSGYRVCAACGFSERGPLNPVKHGPALPPRECPCDGRKLRPGQKAHLASCKLQHLGTEEGYERSLAGLPHLCREPGCENPKHHSMLCKPHGGVPLAERLPQVTGKLTV